MFIRSGYSAHTRSVAARAPHPERCAPRSGTQHHDRAADVVLGRRQRDGGERAQSGRRALTPQGVLRDAIELDDTALARERAIRIWRAGALVALAWEDASLALDDDAAPARAHAHRDAHAQQPVRPRGLWRGGRLAAGAVEWLEGPEDRACQHAAGSQMETRPPQKRCASAGSPEKLNRLH